MIEYLIIGAIIVMNMAARKNKMPVFGQLTLTGEKAVDWVKPEMVTTCRKIWFGNGPAFSEFNLPEWAKEKGICALIFPINEYQNPVLVTQKSILRVIEAKCCEWEAEGAAVNVLKTGDGNISEILFSENHPSFEFIRPKNAKQYDPYKVVIDTA